MELVLDIVATEHIHLPRRAQSSVCICRNVVLQAVGHTLDRVDTDIGNCLHRMVGRSSELHFHHTLGHELLVLVVQLESEKLALVSVSVVGLTVEGIAVLVCTFLLDYAHS